MSIQTISTFVRSFLVYLLTWLSTWLALDGKKVEDAEWRAHSFSYLFILDVAHVATKGPPIFYVAKNWQLKDRRFPMVTNET